MELKIKNKPDPRIMIPASIAQPEGKHYTGSVVGYYVDNSNYYNVVPTDAQIDPTRVTTLGYILSSNIFKFITSRTVQLLTVEIEKGLTPAERLHARLKKGTVNEVYSHDISIAELQENIQILFNEAPFEWWTNEFLPAINYVDNPTQTIVGYWENDELHLIQVGTRKEIKIDTYTLKLDVFSRNTGILESSIMLNKTALFVGCGSVGSLVAVELAKAGVGKFMLVDNDIFGYHNICRHQCGIYDVGRYKTDAVADRILQINPYATVIKKNTMIQDVDRDEIFAFCNHDSIVIGGADNREGDLYANQFAIEIGMPFMSIGCWERAFAGEIFYCLPSGMPTYEDFLDAAGYISGRVTQNRRFYTTEEELEKISFEPGISADVNFVTIVAVKIALDLLNKDNECYTQRLLPHLTQYTLICNTNDSKIGGEQAEIFSYPLQITTSIVVPYRKKN